MGRYYSGQISGKFWFGVQSSTDATNLGCNPKHIINYHACRCQAEDIFIEDTDDNEELDQYKNNYCTNCFGSFEEHMQEIKEDEPENSDNKTWSISDHEIEYQFESRHIAFLDAKIAELEQLVGQYITEYNIKDEDNEITYDCMPSPELSNDMLELTAQLCLGRQISYCLHNKGSCYFYAEL